MTLPSITTAGFVQRIVGLLPLPWFSDAAVAAGGVLYALLYGAGEMLTLLLGQLVYWLPQTRIATATDVNLEAIANDFFGPGQFPRYITLVSGNYVPESDAAYSARIRAALIAPANTLGAIQNAVNAYLTQVYAYLTSFGSALSFDAQGGFDTFGVFDSLATYLIAEGVPTVTVFDLYSNLPLATQIGLQPGQFCILFTFTGAITREGLFLNYGYLNRGEYLISNSITTNGPPLTPQLAAIVNHIKAEGLQPVYAYQQGV